ncbi:MAG: alpha/beta hydrolase family protein [Bdellovibrionales bacterium]|nr:alpha/beta hydrolase family protein [Bdellovibrionales bacterium]
MTSKRGKKEGSFCFLDTSDEYRLSTFERLTLTGGGELERAIRWLSSQFGKLPVGDPTIDFNRKLFEQSYQFYTSQRWMNSPEDFFVSPTEAPTVSERCLHKLADGEVVDLEYASQYRVQFRPYASTFKKFKENGRVHVRLWRHRERARCTVVAIHGWTMGDQRLNSLAFLPGMFYNRGLDVALIELPFHGRRKPKVSVAGELLFPSANIARTNESMGQVISDLRQLHLYLKESGTNDIGLVGMSLGAYIAALWCSLGFLDFCIPVVPLVSLAEVAWDVLHEFDRFSLFERAGISLEVLEQVYHIHSPLAHHPKISPRRVLILAGLGDSIVPPGQPKLLWQHWGMPTLYWMRGGHVAQLQRSRGYKEIVAFLGRLGYL